MLAKSPKNATFGIQSRGRALTLVTVLVLMMGYLLMHELSGAWDAPPVEAPATTRVEPTTTDPMPVVTTPTPLRPSSDELLEIDLPIEPQITPLSAEADFPPLLEPSSATLISELPATGDNPLRVGTRPVQPPR